MSWFSIIMIALALAMDAFAVSIASGIAIRNLRLHHALTIALWFGGFQAIMPLLGWFGGAQLSAYISGWDHWVAFGLLAFIGGKMIYEAFRIEDVEKETDPLEVSVLLVLAVATSLDALVTGFTFALLRVSILAPIIAIGSVTFCLSFAGVLLGNRGGHFFEKKIEIIGGLVLIGIGVKTLLGHGVAG
jgi:putative Mn2+ efflux pump MntP